ncbi:Clavaminate synthase-like protein [Cystobasidium minutum MCA 4210]|uniref:Clavaminate synthase-like protein n=1 Tax=Cystobasidium minutum MCA 4210 TaxID=1397322 RepID=UPI0034CFFAEE|eukprot:jgi/Rhomi1/42501/CE42500_582
MPGLLVLTASAGRLDITMSLPIVDISPYLADDFVYPPTAKQLACSAAIHQACLDFGFFYITGLGIPRQDFDDILELSKQFFDLPVDVKEALSIASTSNGTDGARGYQKLKENTTLGKLDFHEGLDFYRPVEDDSNQELPLHGQNQWPSEAEVPSFRTKVQKWMETMLKLGRILVLATGVGLGMDDGELEDLLSLVDESFWVMRCIGYPPLPDTHDGVSCGAHKDYGCYTLLHATPQTGALKVYRPKTGEWVDADPIPEHLVINIGEMWEVWTNGLYKSTLHKVIHQGDSYRVSVPFFFEPNWHAEIRPLDAAMRIQEANDQDVGTAKKSVIYGDFLTKKVAGNFSINGKTTGKRY